LMQIQISNSQDGTAVLTGSHTFTAGGGYENHTIEIVYSAGATGGPVLLTRTLWAMVGKR